jgi:hypothetical protein
MFGRLGGESFSVFNALDWRLLFIFNKSNSPLIPLHLQSLNSNSTSCWGVVALMGASVSNFPFETEEWEEIGNVSQSLESESVGIFND